MCDPVRVRTAYRCRAYPDQPQQQVLARTFGCVRVVWNRTLAARRARYAADGTGTSYAQTDRALTQMKKRPGAGVPDRSVQRAAAAGAAASAQGVRRVLRQARAIPAVQVPAWQAVRALHPVSVHPARRDAAAGWGEFRRQLEYKCERYGRRLIVIDRWYPPSKTCSACGHLLAELNLSTRHWTCPSCGARHDRDVNAAKNILAAGLAVARGSPGDACGAGVRHSGYPRMRPAVKQEPRPVTAGIPVLQGGK